MGLPFSKSRNPLQGPHESLRSSLEMHGCSLVYSAVVISCEDVLASLCVDAEVCKLPAQRQTVTEVRRVINLVLKPKTCKKSTVFTSMHLDSHYEKHGEKQQSGLFNYRNQGHNKHYASICTAIEKMFE